MHVFHPNDELPECVSTKTVTRSKGYQYNIRYIPSVFKDPIPHAAKPYRSVITSAATGRVVCVAAPESYSLSEFCETTPEWTDNLFVTETYEGTMMNLFWNPEIEEWEVATRSGVGGNYWYQRYPFASAKVRQLTFREMFIEGIQGIPFPANYDIPTLNEFIESLVTIVDNARVRVFEKEFIYSFVMQHPQNHFVFNNIFTPRVILTAIFTSEFDENTKQSFVREYYVNESGHPGINTIRRIKRLGKQSGSTVDILENASRTWFHSRGSKTMYRDKTTELGSMGYMIHDVSTNIRFSLENPTYLAVRELRGNNPNMKYQYYTMRQDHAQLHSFLTYFPQYGKLFREYEAEIAQFCSHVYQAYVHHFIMGVPLSDPSSQENMHAKRIHHQIYVPLMNAYREQMMTTTTTSEGDANNANTKNAKMPTKPKIHYNTVRDYIHQFRPGYLFHCLHPKQENNGGEVPRAMEEDAMSIDDSMEDAMEDEMKDAMEDDDSKDSYDMDIQSSYVNVHYT